MNSHDDSADTSVIDFYGILGRLRLQYAEQETSTDNHINETPMSDFKEIVVKKSRQVNASSSAYGSVLHSS